MVAEMDTTNVWRSTLVGTVVYGNLFRWWKARHTPYLCKPHVTHMMCVCKQPGTKGLVQGTDSADKYR
ncbi:hypothetical protein AMTRI_Chr02g217770 [Amborella trichopoda]